MSEADPFKPITVRIRDACRMTGIGRSKLYEFIESGDLEVVKVGRMTLIYVSALEAFVARHRGTKPGRYH